MSIVGIAEMLAMEMKSCGMYVSRGLSYRQTQFQTVEISLSEEQVKMYNTSAYVWYMFFYILILNANFLRIFCFVLSFL